MSGQLHGVHERSTRLAHPRCAAAALTPFPMHPRAGRLTRVPPCRSTLIMTHPPTPEHHHTPVRADIPHLSVISPAAGSTMLSGEHARREHAHALRTLAPAHTQFGLLSRSPFALFSLSPVFCSL